MNQKLKYYYLYRLSETEKKICDLIVNGILQLQKEVMLPFHNLDFDTVNKILGVIRLDYPECWYLDHENTLIWRYAMHSKIELGYVFTDKQIHYVNRKLKNTADKILSAIPQNATVSETEKFLHDYLVQNVRYAPDTSNELKAYSMVGALLFGNAVCEGYAKTLKYLFDLAGLPCLIVSATATNQLNGKPEGHAWNIVGVSPKQCCHVDVTWDSCAYHGNNFAYTFYNQTDEQMEIDHFWNHSDVPACTVRGDSPIFYCDTHQELEQLLCENVRQSVSSFAVRVRDGFKDTNAVLQFMTIVFMKHFIYKQYGVIYRPERKQIEFLSNP